MSTAVSSFTPSPDKELVYDNEVDPFDLIMIRTEDNPRFRTSGFGLGLFDVVPDFGRFQETFERISRVVPRFRQKVVEPAFRTGPARWVYDADFDIDFHVRRIALPAPGSIRQLLEFTEKEGARGFDLGRPLWEMFLVEGINEGPYPAAMMMKPHHALTDGIGAVQLGYTMYDFEREVDHGPMPPIPTAEDLTPLELSRQHLRQLPGRTLGRLGGLARGTLGVGARALHEPGAFAKDTAELVGSIGRVLSTATTDPSPLLAPRSLGRHMEYLDHSVTEFRQAAHAAGGSINDAYLAALTGALRRYHDAMGMPVDEIPVAIPVNVRKETDTAGGNHWAAARLTLPIAEVDPARRIKKIHAIVHGAIHEPALDALGFAMPLAAGLPDFLMGALSGIVSASDLQASNVAGYPDKPFVSGARIERRVAFGPLPGVPLMAVMYSEGGHAVTGIHCDTASFTDTDLFRQCLEDGYGEVLALG